jgi:hypothetical protein
MNYFGTNLTSAGHYFWTLEDDKLHTPRLSFVDYPFDPYTILDKKRPRYVKGETGFLQIDGYSVLAIEGSPTDDRWGTVSVFFVRELIDRELLCERILAHPFAKQIIACMPFDVLW